MTQEHPLAACIVVGSSEFSLLSGELPSVATHGGQRKQGSQQAQRLHVWPRKNLQYTRGPGSPPCIFVVSRTKPELLALTTYSRAALLLDVTGGTDLVLLAGEFCCFLPLFPYMGYSATAHWCNRFGAIVRRRRFTAAAVKTLELDVPVSLYFPLACKAFVVVLPSSSSGYFHMVSLTLDVGLRKQSFADHRRWDSN